MRKARQAGAALLVAMLTVTLVATFAAAALWQQWRSVEIEAADRTRIQSSWILTGALDWARLILREDVNSDGIDHLNEPWAVPLQEARLSTFLAADSSNNADTAGSDADNVFLSGEISDLQAKMNLTKLLQAGTINQEVYRRFQRLFEVLGLPQAELAKLAENLRFAGDISIDNRNASRAPLMPQRVDQLSWLGVSPPTVAALEPYVTILPSTLPEVNVNTAPAEVIYAAGTDLTLADARRLVVERERQPFRVVSDVTKIVPSARFENGVAAVKSSYFEVRGRLRLGDVVIEERSMLLREGRNVRTLQRERGTFQAAAAVPAR